MKHLKLKSLLAFFVFAALGLGVMGVNRYVHTAKVEADLNANNRVLTQKLKISTDQLGRQTARAGLLVLSNKALLSTLSEQDTEISRLQALVARNPKHTTAAVIVNTETNTKFAFKPRVLVDTVYLRSSPDSCQNVTYTGEKTTPYGYISITANKDSVTGVYKNFETGTFTQVNEKAGFFRARRPVVYYTSSNPNTIITGLQGYTVKQPKGQKAKAFGAGSAVTILILGTLKILN